MATRIDPGIVAALVAFIVMLGIALYGPVLAPHDPYFAKLPYNGRTPPYDPDGTFPLGSDSAGRDRLSLLLYGARTTLVIAAAAGGVRLLLGGALGVAAGWRSGTLDLLVGRIALGISSVPGTLATLLLLLTLDPTQGVVPFVIALSVFGWVDAFRLSRRYTRAESVREYIAAARALGLTERRLVARHLIPNIAPLLITAAALQVSAVLVLLAELALLRIFYGGVFTVDIFGRGVLLPAEAEWASMLGTTRPAFDIYGNPVAVLAPAAALLVAVIAVHLFADRLAERAAQLDLFHLLGRRQFALLAGLLVILMLPALLWPGRLAAEVEYARGLDPSVGVRVAKEGTSAPIGPAPSVQRIAGHLGGDVVPFTETVLGVLDAHLTLGDRTVPAGDFRVLSLRDSEVTGDLVLQELGTGRLASDDKEKIIVMRTVTRQSLRTVLAGLPRGTQGLIVVDGVGLTPDPNLPLPLVEMSGRRFEAALGLRLPPRGSSTAGQLRPLGAAARISVRIGPLAVEGANVVARISPTLSGKPLVVIAAPYPDKKSVSIDAVAVLAAVGDRLRRDSLDIQILLLSVPASADLVALSAALRSLHAEERQNLVGLILVRGASTAPPLRPDPFDPQSPPASSRIARRVAEATGAHVSAQLGAELLLALFAADARAPTFEVGEAGIPSEDVKAQGIEAAGRTVLALAAYVARHVDEVRE